MKLWKYAIIGITGRGILMLLDNLGVNEIITWIIFAIYFSGVIFLIQRDIRQWNSNRKAMGKENDNGQ